jgi:hypothetical protein
MQLLNSSLCEFSCGAGAKPPPQRGRQAEQGGVVHELNTIWMRL